MAERYDALQEIATRVIRLSMERGATDAECTVAEGEEFSVNVRLGEVETLTDAGSRGAGARILIGKHTGSGYRSDLTERRLDRMINSSLEPATITTEDPFAG